MGGILGLLAAQAQAQTSAASPPDEDALLQACAQSLACTSHLKRANQLYGQNLYAAALDEYQAAYILQPYPLILYNIARIHHKQSHLSDALVYYQRYLGTGHGTRAERARQLLAEAKQELEGQQLTATPAPVPVTPAQPPTIAPPPVPPVAPPPVPTVAPSPVPTVAPSSVPTVALSPVPTVAPPPTPPALRLKTPVYKQWWFWTLLGVAAAGAATAVGIGVYAQGPDISGLTAKTFPLGK